MTKNFPLVGLWVEKTHGVEPRQSQFTANLGEETITHMVNAGDVAVRHGAISYSVREYKDSGNERIIGIGDSRGFNRYRR